MTKLTKLLPGLTSFAAGHWHTYDPLAGVNLAAEYALIQAKRSKLSASERMLVVARYALERDGQKGGAQ